MNFESIIFERSSDRVPEEQLRAPDFFVDLNLDQIVAAVTTGKEEYKLTPFFHAPLREVGSILFRHEVLQDLEDPGLLHNIKAFATSMKTVRAHLGELDKRYYERQKEWWFLDAVDRYGDAVSRLVQDLSAATLRSRGLLAFQKYLTQYASSEYFTSLIEQADRLKAALAEIRYSLFIRDLRVEVHPYGGKPDYSAEVAATFERFSQGGVHEYVFKFHDSPEMDHVEGRILDGVAYLNQETFSELANYRVANKDFLSPIVVAFDREIEFYIAYLDYIAPLKKAGLNFCYPRISPMRKEVYNEQGFDLALAAKLIRKGGKLVCNGFCLKGSERIIVVSGPNQGGKTTFARTFGQLHYLASLGLPVPGTSAQLYLFDRLLTHFEREEQMTNLRGKLEDDIVRMHAILKAATPRSIIIINEIFASTALRDAVFLSKKIATTIIERDILCVWVTFLDEIASLGEKTVSMVSTVMPDNPAQRTFKIVRRPADGLAYAMSLAEKYRLTFDMIRERTAP